MAIEVRWFASTPASSLHCAAAMLSGAALVDQKVTAALGGEASGLRGDLAAIGLDESRFFEHAVGLCVLLAAPREWAKATLAKLSGPDYSHLATERLARRLVGLVSAIEQAHPGALEELETRAGPLREQWEARGPGLMAGMVRLTEDALVVPAADVILVHPVQGGGGVAHWPYNSVRIEAVLTNPRGELPEVVRLAWLLAQLNLDLEKLAGGLARDRLALVGPLALIPPILAAAQDVELARLDIETIALALAAWRTQAVDAAVLLDWWETYHSTRPGWPAALGALDCMLAT